MWLASMVEKSLMEGLLVLLCFPRSSLNEWICSEGLLPTKEDDILKQSRAFLRIRWLSSSSYPDSRPLTMETAIFVKSHLKKWLFSLPTGANRLLELGKSTGILGIKLHSRWSFTPCNRKSSNQNFNWRSLEFLETRSTLRGQLFMLNNFCSYGNT